MPDASSISTVAHVIQLAVAPVFLLTAISGLLSVLINRLARVVDRFRALDIERLVAGLTPIALRSIQEEMHLLSKRARYIHWAVGLCTSCALLICVVIAALFIGSLVAADLSIFISWLFIAAMVLLVLALLCFLHEITLAKSNIHVVPH
jgi:hypothetical protein